MSSLRVYEVTVPDVQGQNTRIAFMPKCFDGDDATDMELASIEIMKE